MTYESSNEAVPQLGLPAKLGIQAELMIRWAARTGEEKVSWVDRFAEEVSSLLGSSPEVRKLIISGNPEDRIRAMEIIEERLDDLEAVSASSKESG